MRRESGQLWQSIKYLAELHLLALAMMSACRLVLLWTNMPAAGIEWGLLLRSLLIGVKFDNLIVCYVQALPVVVLTTVTMSVMKRADGERIIAGCKRVIACVEGVVYGLVIVVETANARYFHFFDNHLNYQVTEWFGFAQDTAGMVLQDKTNLLFFGIAAAMTTIFELALVRMTRRATRKKDSGSQENAGYGNELTAGKYVIGSVVCILLYGAVFAGMRGSLQRYPLKVSFAYFCDKPLYNKLGVNPIFNIIKTAENGDKNAIPDFLMSVNLQEAEEYVKEESGYGESGGCIKFERRINKANVVLVLMESMTSENLEREYAGQYLTPYLRGLRDSSIYCSNAFSAGIHTNNGIVASQYGYLPNFARSMMDVDARHYRGLPYYLQEAGYNNIAFVTGNPQYDNMNSFWRENGITTIYSLYDYDSEAVVNNFGVPDDYMFRWGIEKLNEETEPFFATFLTVSNHTPYVVPEAFMGRGKNDEERIIAYADDAVRHFMESAKKTGWGKNTVFILSADHGAPLQSDYEMNPALNSIPIFFAGAEIEPQLVESPVSQTDIFPTVLSMLGIEYENDGIGIDLLRGQRKYATFVSNEHLGVSDGEWLWCYGVNSKQERLYKIGNEADVRGNYPEKAKEMKKYGTYMQRVDLERMKGK